VNKKEEPQMFFMGRVVDFEGLRVLVEGLETYLSIVFGGNIEVNEVLNEIVEDRAMMFNRDTRESLEEEE